MIRGAAGGKRAWYPNFNGIQINGSCGTSSYHALQLTIETAFKTALERLKAKDCIVLGVYTRYKDEVKENSDRVRRILTGSA